MNNDYVIVTDSCCDLPEDVAEQYGLVVLPLHFRFGDEEYRNFLDGREMSNDEFYARLEDSKLPKTSAVNEDEYIATIRPILASGKDVLIVSFSSALSVTAMNAELAAKELAEEYPARKIYAVDSLCASVGLGLFLHYAYENKQKGMTIEENRDWLEANKLRFDHMFMVADLYHLRKGGRLSFPMALIGTLLHVKPLLHVSPAGKLVPYGKTRGRRQSMERLVKDAIAAMDDPSDLSAPVWFCHSHCVEEAEKLKNMMFAEIGNHPYLISCVGPVIGAHIGKGTLSIFFVGRNRLTK